MPISPFKRRTLAAVVSAMVLPCAFAQQYPVKPVRVFVATTPGGYLDRTARLIGDKLGQRMGQSFIMENRAGAGGNIAGKAAAESPPDGYTLLVTTTQITVNATLYKDPGFNLLTDLVPVGIAGGTPGVFAVHPSNPARSLKELIANAQGKRLTHGSGIGTSSHVAADYLFRILAKLDAAHVPFKGGAPAVAAVLGNQVEVLNSSMGSVLPHAKAGKLRPLAIAGPKRDPALPDVPTVAELGFPGFAEISWVAFFAPSKTPSPVVNRLNSEINQVLVLPDINKALTELGMDITPGSPAAHAEYVKAELAAWTRMVKETGATID
ncbi:MAG: tripartite tricarboxylate transporter substrate binding protein [Betaproteobacteria bacterium]|nr:tripartite tricarboxylate transporter substrate binding protein [Betaproteobacteria bacterium]